MARSGQKDSGRATVGAIPVRTRNPKTGLWTDREMVPGKFMDIKKSGGTLKRIRRED